MKSSAFPRNIADASPWEILRPAFFERVSTNFGYRKQFPPELPVISSISGTEAQLVPVLIRDTVEQGDVVLMDYQGSVGGVPFPGGTGSNALIEIGGDGYLPGFSEGLLGAKVGSKAGMKS